MAGKDQSTDIEQLIAEFEASGLRELHARVGDFEIYLSTDGNAVGLEGAAEGSSAKIVSGALPSSSSEPAAAKAHEAPKVAPAAVSDALNAPEGAVIVHAPYLGTFYRSPKPGAEPFVEIGQEVSETTELCLVEVMKLFTAVRAECRGKVHSVFASDGDMVSADQPLFAVVPV